MKERFGELLGEGVGCPYCIGHWLSFGATIIYRPIIIKSGIWVVIDLATSAFLIIALATIISRLWMHTMGNGEPMRDILKRFNVELDKNPELVKKIIEKFIANIANNGVIDNNDGCCLVSSNEEQKLTR